MSENGKKMTSIERIMSKSTGLTRALSVKAAVMTGVGSTIGTGLFLSSGDVINKAGPGGAIVAYLIGGLVAFLMVTCLGEMSSAMPVSGSFQAFTTEYCGPALGFTVGWVNWIAAAATIPAQIVAAAIIMKDIIPNSPTWVWIVLFTVLLFGLNFLDAGTFGTFSFWFSILKILLIIVFIIFGVAMMGGTIGGETIGFSRYTGEGGAFPAGAIGIGSVFLTAFYAYAGCDLVAATAGELKDQNSVRKAINLELLVLIGATIITIAIVASILPWQEASILGSPFVYVFKQAGMHSAALVVNIIVLTSALSSGNYFVYGCTRYLWSMAKFGQAPKWFIKTTKQGVPGRALLISMLFAVVAIIAEFIAEDTVYLFLVYFIGGGNIFIYSMICICQYKFRKTYLAEGGKLEDLKYKVLSYPAIPILGVVSFAVMLGFTLYDPAERIAIFIGAPCYLAIYIFSRIYVKKTGGEAANIDI